MEVLRQEVQQCRIDLHLTGEGEGEVVFGGAAGADARLSQQHRGSRGRRALWVVPGGHANGQEAGLDAALFNQFPSLVPDCAGPPMRLTERFLI